MLTEPLVAFDVMVSFSPTIIALIIAFGWACYPHVHFYFFLLVFEIAFLAVALDFMLTSSLFNTPVEVTLQGLMIITFAALESIVGLSFLIFYAKTGDLNRLRVLAG